MPKGKINLQMLSEVMSLQCGYSKSSAELFLRTLFSVLKEALQKDNIVKIKGFGTFKLVVVGARESVDVNTGERVSIAEYNKITFTPDKILKERVNRPFAQFDTLTVDEQDISIISEMEDAEDPDVTDNSDTALDVQDTDTKAEDSPTGKEPSHIEQESKDSDGDKENIMAQKDETSSVVDEKAVHPSDDEDNSDNSQVDHAGHDQIKPHDSIEKNPSSLPNNKEHVADTDEPELSAVADNSNIGKSDSRSLTEDTNEASKNDAANNEDAKEVDKDSDNSNRGNGRACWRCLMCLLFVVTAMATYVLGYMRIIPTPWLERNTEAKAVEVIKTDSIKKDTLIKAAPKRIENDSIAQLRKDAADFEQIPNSKFLIAGTRTFRRIKPDYDLARWCMQIYGTLDVMPYVLKYNSLDSADNVAVGKIIKFPKLIDR